jgi:putative NADPH-quinone reductase
MMKYFFHTLHGKKLVVIGTTGAKEVLNKMGMIDVFNKSFHVLELKPPEIKKVSFSAC